MQIGAAEANVIIELPVTLAGFGARKGLAEGTHDDLTAQAVVFRDDAETLCLLVFDLLLMDRPVADAVRVAVGAALGIPATNVLTSCTHTHSGPSPSRNTRWLRWPCPPGLPAALVTAGVTAAMKARDALAEQELRFARGPLPAELSMNRRDLPYDPTFAVLSAGTAVTITNVGLHPVALGITCREVATDWVGPFRAKLAELTGVPAVLVPGALGDVNPTRDPHESPDAAGNYATTDKLGADLAVAAHGLLASAEPLTGGLKQWVRTIRPRTGITIPSVLQGVPRRRVDVELCEWAIGELRLVSVPGEGFHALGRDIEQARPGPVMIAGLAPWWQGYLPVPFRKGYEETMSLGRGFVAEVAAALSQQPR